MALSVGSYVRGIGHPNAEKMRERDRFSASHARLAFDMGVWLGSNQGTWKAPLALEDHELELRVEGRRLTAWNHRLGVGVQVLWAPSPPADIRLLGGHSSLDPEQTLLQILEALLLRTPQGSASKNTRALVELTLCLFGPSGLVRSPTGSLSPKEECFEHPKLLAFDFNGTIARGAHLRPHITEALFLLSRMGAANVLTTRMDRNTAMSETNAIGLPMLEVFGASDIGSESARSKCYSKVIDSFGLHGAHASAHFATIGDQITDLPADLQNTLSIELDAHAPAAALPLLLGELDLLGAGHFYRGAESLFAGRRSEPRATVELGPLSFWIERASSGLVVRGSVGTSIRATFEICLEMRADTTDSAVQERALQLLAMDALHIKKDRSNDGENRYNPGHRKEPSARIQVQLRVALPVEPDGGHEQARRPAYRGRTSR